MRLATPKPALPLLAAALCATLLHLPQPPTPTQYPGAQITTPAPQAAAPEAPSTGSLAGRETPTWQAAKSRQPLTLAHSLAAPARLHAPAPEAQSLAAASHPEPRSLRLAAHSGLSPPARS